MDAAITSARQRVELAGQTISYLEWAVPAPRRTVLLLHGGGADSAELSWGGLGPQLAAAGYRVVAPDHPGYGHSPAAATVSQEALVDYVGELVAALDLRDYVIGGISLGGGLTLGHLLSGAGSPVGAVLLASYGIMGRMTEGPLAALWHRLTYWSVRSGLLDWTNRQYRAHPGLIRFSLGSLVADRSRQTPELLAELREAVATTDGLTAFGQWQHDQTGPDRLRTDYSSRLGEITIPVLLVHGSRDRGVPVAAARRAAWRLPQGRLVELAGAAHWVQRDRPDEVLDALLGFLETLGD